MLFITAGKKFRNNLNPNLKYISDFRHSIICVHSAEDEISFELSMSKFNVNLIPSR